MSPELNVVTFFQTTDSVDENQYNYCAVDFHLFLRFLSKLSFFFFSTKKLRVYLFEDSF